MKTLTLIIITLLLTTPCLAGSGSVAITLSGTAGAAGATYTCTDCVAAGTCDVFCEDFDSGTNNCGTGESKCYTASWSADETNGTIAVAAGNTSGQSCSEKGSNSAAFVTSASAAGTMTIGHTMTLKTDVYASFMIRFGNFGTIASGSDDPILQLFQGDFAGRAVRIALKNTSGTYNLAICSDGAGTCTAEGTNLSLNTWYHVQVHAVKAATSSLKVNGGAAATITGGNFNMEYVFVGNYLDSYANVAYELDTLKIDDDTETSSCH
jgi:hypothetical protein